VDANNTYSTGVTVGGGTAFNNRQFYLLLELPSDVGNEVQSDAVQWDLKFEAIQARNNEDCGTVVQLPETSYIGYEDQLVDQPFSDFDYNDFGMFADITEIYSGGDLSKIEMTFEAEVREAGDDSDIHIKRTFGSGVTYDYTVTRPNHVSAGFETAAGTTNASGNLDITLFDTGEGDRVGNRVEITVENISGSVSQPSGSPRPDIAANNDLFAVYDPYLENRSTGTTIDIERVNDNVESGDLDGSGDGWDDQSDVPSIIVIPDAGFVPPAEGDPMPTKYAEFNDYYGDDSGDTDGDLDVNPGFDDWYLNPNP
jgi:hypothetical protein